MSLDQALPLHLDQALQRREEMLLQLGAALQHLEKEYERVKAEVIA